MTSKKVEDVDLYALLELNISATESEIKKAYRKKALQCHPDKNPDNPKAAETFHELSRALEILTDASARSAYDKVLRAKEAAKLRHKELDHKRQKLKEDLERKEQAASSGTDKYNNLTDEQKLAAEIERLRKEGSRLLQEEQQRIKEEIKKSQMQGCEVVWDPSLNRIKVKWNADKDDPKNGGYDEATLRRFFKKYGDVSALIVSSSKKGSALVEFSTKEGADMAVEFEKGLPENPLKLKYVHNRAILKPKTTSSVISDRDYESLVLTKMRQAAERQKLIEEMMKEENK